MNEQLNDALPIGSSPPEWQLSFQFALGRPLTSLELTLTTTSLVTLASRYLIGMQAGIRKEIDSAYAEIMSMSAADRENILQALGKTVHQLSSRRKR